MIKFVSMIEFATFIKNNGIIGVIAIWVFLLNQEVNQLKADLTECNHEKTEIMKPFVRPNTSRNERENNPLMALIQTPLVIKQDEDERS